MKHLLDRELTVRRRVADVFLARSHDPREPSTQDRDDLGRLVDRERRLRHIRKLLRFGHPDRTRLRGRLDERDRLGCLSRRSDDLVVSGMSDQDDPVARRGEPAHLGVHFRDERAGCVHRREPTSGSVPMDARRDTMGREHQARTLRNLVFGLDEDRPASLEVGDDVHVVDDVFTYVDRRAVGIERLQYSHHRPLDAGAEASWLSEQHPLHDATVKNLIQAERRTAPRSDAAVFAVAPLECATAACAPPERRLLA